MKRVPMFTVRPGRPALPQGESGHDDVQHPTARMGAVPPAETSAGMKCRGDDPVRLEGAVKPIAPKRPIRPTPGTSISTTATPTPTIRPIATRSGSCVAEREPAGEQDDQGTFGLFALWRAYRACRRGKRHTRDTQRYEAGLPDRLVSSRNALARFTWRPSRTLSFVVSSPKLREIHAAPFADRVVHHLLVNRLARIYEPVFIHDSYANRLGKGTHAAVDRLQGFMRSAAGRREGEVYALQLDIANFFNSIHRPTLFRLIQGRLKRAVRRQGLAPEEARALQRHCRALLEADPTAGVRRKGPPGLFAQVPPHKRLGAMGPASGLPIGNLTSQFFANVYLNELDQFVKHSLKARWYVRYVDDFVLLHADPRQLIAWRGDIERFLGERLDLKLRDRAEPRPVQAGVDFLGYIVRPFYKLVRRRAVRRLFAQLAEFARRHVRADERHFALRLPPLARDLLRARLASYLGHLRHANSFSLWQQTLARFPWLGRMFDLPLHPLPMNRPQGKGRALTTPMNATRHAAPSPGLRPIWEPVAVTGLAGQYRYFVRHYPGCCVLMQVGRNWLLAGAAGIAGVSGVSLSCVNAVRVHRPGLGGCVEIPAPQLAAFRQQLKRDRRAHVLAGETGHYQTGFKRRALRLLWQPLADQQQSVR